MLPLIAVYGIDAPLRSTPGSPATRRSYRSTLLGGPGRRVTIAPALPARLRNDSASRPAVHRLGEGDAGELLVVGTGGAEDSHLDRLDGAGVAPERLGERAAVPGSRHWLEDAATAIGRLNEVRPGGDGHAGPADRQDQALAVRRRASRDVERAVRIRGGDDP